MWKQEEARAIAEAVAREGGVVTGALRALVDRFGYVDEAAIPMVADVFNRSKAEVKGAISFYEDFRTTPPPKHVIRICRAEACQAVGARELEAHAERRLAAKLDGPAEGHDVGIEAVYCLGLCACGPAVLVDGEPHGRVDAEKFDTLLGGCTEALAP